MARSTLQNMSISLPQADVSLLRGIARRMGWSLKKEKAKSAFQLSMEEADRGEVTAYESVEDFEAKVLKGNGV